MEHAKKMVLLPKESVDRLQALSNHGKLNSVQTPGTTISRLDAEMNEILNSTDSANEREKWQQYSQVLQRYLHFKDSGNACKKKKEDEKEEEEEEETDNIGDPPDQIDAQILLSVPPKFSVKASHLLRHLRKFSGVTWDADGKTFVDGVLLRKANIVDLINDAMRERKKMRPPAGYTQFATALRRAGIPREFIGNTRVLRFIDSSFSTSSPNKSDLFDRTLNKSVSGDSEYEDPLENNSKRDIESTPLNETPVLKKSKLTAPSASNLKKWTRLRNKK